MSGQKVGSTAGRVLAAEKCLKLTEKSKSVDEKVTSAGNGVSGGKGVPGGKGAPDGGDGGDPGNGSTSTDTAKPWYKRKGFIGAAIGTAIGATAAVVAAPLVIAAVGFGAGGIAAGSIAAGMMSSAAIANGGAVAAGSLVAILQSIGAAGFGVAGLVGVGAAGAGVGAAVGGGAGAVADRIAGNGETEAQEEEADSNEGEGVVDRVSAGNGNAQVVPDSSESEPQEGQPGEKDLMAIIVRESDGNLRSFNIHSSEPLQKVFDEYFVATGLSPGSVIFQFNGMPLNESVIPSQVKIENGDVIKALRI